MAKVTTLVDDFDEKAGKTVKSHTFKLDGQMYYVDLSDANWKALVMDRLADVIGVSRAAGTSGSGTSVSVGDEDYDTEEIRTWLRDHQYDVKDKGRISADHIAAFVKAMEQEQNSAAS